MHSRLGEFWTVWWVINFRPFLWRKVRRGLSAGRVQSVAVRLIVDREKEIEAFQPEEYWNIDAVLCPPSSTKNLRRGCSVQRPAKS